ncbi:MAG: hypothetical protein WDA29_08725 [Flavobacteriaceae bacterium]
MKLHTSAIDKLIKYFHLYGDSTPDEVRLRRFIEGMDFTPYKRQTNDGEEILVLTEDFIDKLNNRAG